MNDTSPKPIPLAFTLVCANPDVYLRTLAPDSSPAKPFAFRPQLPILLPLPTAFRRDLTPNSKLFPQTTALNFHILNMRPRI
jgi:hypothetical protein